MMPLFTEAGSSGGRAGLGVKRQCLSQAMLSLGHPWVVEAAMPNRHWVDVLACSGERPELGEELWDDCAEGTVEDLAVAKTLGGL